MTTTQLDTRAAHEELRLLSHIERSGGLLPVRRIVNHGQGQTLGAAGLLVPRDMAEGYERLASLPTPLVDFDKEQLINASGRIETARVRLTDAGFSRLERLRAESAR